MVSGSDVYVTGMDPFGRATLWKNGDTSYLSDRGNGEIATCIAVSGSDVYVGGIKSAPSWEVKYWKNGVPGFLTRGIYANDIAVSGSDVYVAGTIKYGWRPGYWKNGTPVNLTDGSRLSYAQDIVVIK